MPSIRISQSESVPSEYRRMNAIVRPSGENVGESSLENPYRATHGSGARSAGNPVNRCTCEPSGRTSAMSVNRVSGAPVSGPSGWAARSALRVRARTTGDEPPMRTSDGNARSGETDADDGDDNATGRSPRAADATDRPARSEVVGRARGRVRRRRARSGRRELGNGREGQASSSSRSGRRRRFACARWTRTVAWVHPRMRATSRVGRSA